MPLITHCTLSAFPITSQKTSLLLRPHAQASETSLQCLAQWAAHSLTPSHAALFLSHRPGFSSVVSTGLSSPTYPTDICAPQVSFQSVPGLRLSRNCWLSICTLTPNYLGRISSLATSILGHDFLNSLWICFLCIGETTRAPNLPDCCMN